MINRTLNLFIFLLVIVVVGIETHTYWLHQMRPWQPATSIGRIIFYYSFFTVLSNIMLAFSCLVLFFQPNCKAMWFSVIRLNGLVGVIITMIVYNLMLRGIHKPPSALLQFANESLHVVVPFLGIITWFIYGPFKIISIKTIGYTFLSLLTYGTYIFVRGYYTHQYPYPFINVDRVGYVKAFIAVGIITGLFFFLAILLRFIEQIRLKLASE